MLERGQKVLRQFAGSILPPENPAGVAGARKLLERLAVPGGSFLMELHDARARGEGSRNLQRLISMQTPKSRAMRIRTRSQEMRGGQYGMRSGDILHAEAGIAQRLFRMVRFAPYRMPEWTVDDAAAQLPAAVTQNIRCGAG